MIDDPKTITIARIALLLVLRPYVVGGTSGERVRRRIDAALKAHGFAVPEYGEHGTAFVARVLDWLEVPR